jgi:hypothetical protein
MTPNEYEEFVAEVVRQLEVGPNVILRRNHDYYGVRQAGKYEIDISLEIAWGGMLKMLVIIECKRWERPVDRPVVQKLIQTRDAIAAQKAAIASPTGFSRESIEVARDNGIALWVLSKAQRITINGISASFLTRRSYQKRRTFLEQINFSLAGKTFDRTLISFASARMLNDASFQHEWFVGNAVGPGANEQGVDPRLASSAIADLCVDPEATEAPQFELPIDS